MTFIPRKLSGFLFAIFLIVLFLFAYHRIYYGVDLADEAYSNAVPYRFALGDIPFVDDIDPHQTSALLLFPIVKIYTLLFGTEFLILFMRHAYLLFTIASAAVIHGTIREQVGSKSSLLIALLVVLYAPAGAVFFNYNRMASIMFSAGCFLALFKPRMLLWGGLLHGLAIVAHPFFVIPCAAFFLILAFRQGILNTRGYIAGAIIPLLALLVMIGIIGFDRFLDTTWSLREGIHGGGLSKLISIFAGLWAHVRYKPILLIACAGLFALSRKTKRASVLLPLLLLLPFLAFTWPDPFAPQWYLILYGLLAPFLMLFVERKNVFLESVFVGVWLPAVFAAVTTAFISANGAMNFGVGILPGALATSILLVCAIRDGMSRWREPLSVLTPAALLVVLLVFQYSFVYGEGDYFGLTQRITGGPYSGLYTTPERQRYMESFIRDIDKFKLEQGRVLFFDFFPAGYLFTRMRPAANSVWLLPPDLYGTNRELTMRYYDIPGHTPDLTVRMSLVYLYNGDPLKLQYRDDDPLLALVGREDPVAYSEEYWRIYSRK